MSSRRCLREDELLDALARGYVRPDLEAHAADCPECRDLRLVASALLEDRAQGIREAPVPSPAAMWYRMQLRHQQEVAAATRRSLLIGQAATLVIGLVLVISFFGADTALEAKRLFATVRLSTPMLIAAATWVVLAPLAGWAAVRKS